MKFACALLCVLMAGDAAAQSKRGDWNILGGLATGTEIRVTLSGGRVVRGFLQKNDADSLLVNATISQETLARQDVKRVQSKRPGHRGRHTLIGLAVGAGGGLAVGAGLDHANQTGWFSDFGKAFLTPVGAIIGTVVGVALPTGGWREVYRTP
jgi:hypothetical protein